MLTGMLPYNRQNAIHIYDILMNNIVQGYNYDNFVAQEL